MKKIFLISILTVITFCGFSQITNRNIVLDKIAASIMENSPVLIEGDCTISNEELDISENFPTTLIVDKTEFILEFNETTIISTNKDFININNDIKEITILDKKDAEEELGINPFVLLINNKEYFESKIVERKKNNLILELNSKKPNLFKKATLTINISQNKISEIVFIDENDTEYDYVITSFKNNVANKKIKFDQKDYPNYSIIDMR
ncbi:MAG: outer-membrane lipoprotein carrier protein LolA [Bacteroidales bacterium]